MRWLRDVGALTKPQPDANEQLAFALRNGTDKWTRAVYRWRHGSRVAFDKVDELAVALGRHISELPDSVWVAGSRGTRVADRPNDEAATWSPRAA